MKAQLSPKQERLLVWMLEQKVIHRRGELTEREILDGVNADGILKLTERQFQGRARRIQALLAAEEG